METIGIKPNPQVPAPSSAGATGATPTNAQAWCQQKPKSPKYRNGTYFGF